MQQRSRQGKRVLVTCPYNPYYMDQKEETTTLMNTVALKKIATYQDIQDKDKTEQNKTRNKSKSRIEERIKIKIHMSNKWLRAHFLVMAEYAFCKESGRH